MARAISFWRSLILSISPSATEAMWPGETSRPLDVEEFLVSILADGVLLPAIGKDIDDEPVAVAFKGVLGLVNETVEVPLGGRGQVFPPDILEQVEKARKPGDRLEFDFHELLYRSTEPGPRLVDVLGHLFQPLHDRAHPLAQGSVVAREDLEDRLAEHLGRFGLGLPEPKHVAIEDPVLEQVNREVAVDRAGRGELLGVDLLELRQRPLEELDVVQLPLERAIGHLVVVVVVEA